jgi:hypothetical protein
MKRTLTLITLFSGILLAFSQTIFAQTEFKTDDPVEYSNYIVTEQERIGKQFIEFSMTLVNSGDYKTNDEKRHEVLKEIELSLRRLRNMAAFKGGTHLRDESISVFEFYKKLHAEEYAKLAVLVTNKESSLAQLEEYFQLQVKVEKQMRKYATRLKAAQEKFAKAHRLTLVHNNMQDQFDKILEANIYSREVFLAFIPVSRINEAWWEAMQVDDFEEMEQQRQALKSAVDADPFGAMEGLNGYTGFRDAASERVQWFGSLAEKEYQEVHDILKNPRRTGEDIDYVNSFIESYNTRNSELNQNFNQKARELKTKALPAASGGGGR